MGKMRTHLLLLFILLVSPILGFSSPTGKRKEMTRIMNTLRRVVEFNARFPQEKVYLHFDNTGYYKGETIWFSAFCIRADKGVPTDLSRVLYVELLTPEGDRVERVKVRLVDGRAEGHFHLDNLLNSGFYEVRAYTRYMLNWPHVPVFSRVLPIFNRHKDREGLLSPSINKRSFKRRLTNHRRTGPDGGDLRGRADGEGCVVRMDMRDEERIGVQFLASDSLNDQTWAYVVMHDGNIQMADTFSACPVAERTLMRHRLADGVNQLVVFDGEGRLLGDRLFFKCPQRPLYDSIAITPLTPTLTPNGRVKLEISSTPNASFSVSVMDANLMPCAPKGNMKTWMLLESEVKEHIAHPEFHFEADDSVHRLATDRFLTAQVWRRYDWTLLVGDSAFVCNHPIEDRMYLRGKVHSRKEGAKVAFMTLKAFLWNGEGRSFSGTTTTDREGYFLWAMPGLRGEYQLQIKLKKERMQNSYYTSIDRNFSPPPSPYSDSETESSPPCRGNLRFPAGGQQVSSSTRRNGEDSHSLNSHFFVPDSILPEVVVQEHRRHSLLGDKEHNIWHDESFGEYRASLHYDCDAATDEMMDRGLTVPTVYDWLAGRNDFFKAETPHEAYYPYNPNQPLTDEGEVENEFEQTNTRKSPNLYRDGFSYRGKPVIWILNNAYAGMTHMGHLFKLETQDDIQTEANSQNLFNQNGRKEYKNFHVTEGTIERIPLMLDEVKSIYISEDPAASLPFLHSTDAQHGAVTIFLYTHTTQTTHDNSVLRHTHYTGYQKPETFPVEDHSVLPPTEDLRRTLYWNPSVTTDEQGHATVEFYNNSSCTEMYISAEGLTKDGHFIVNENE